MNAGQLHGHAHGSCVGEEPCKSGDSTGALRVACRRCPLMSQANEKPLNLHFSNSDPSLADRNAVGLPLFLVWKSFGEPGIRGFTTDGATGKPSPRTEVLAPRGATFQQVSTVFASFG
jgi:hypothetical protein